MGTAAKRRWISGLLAAGLLGIAFGYPAGQAKSEKTPVRSPRRVETARVKESPGRARFRAHGVVRAQDRAALSFTVPGRLLTRPVRVGDHVQAGALLARIDGRGYDHGARAAEATARQAEAQLALQERDRLRLETLEQQKAVSRDQLERLGSAVDAARAGRDAAEVQQREAQRNLRETELRAPFAGVVVAVLLEPGEFAGPGHPVLVLSGDGGLEVEVEVPGRVTERLSTGDSASVRFPLDAEGSAVGNVVSVSVSAAGPGRLFPVLLTFARDAVPGVHPGSAAEIEFALRAPVELMVPASAIVAPSGVDAAVFKLVDGSVERVPVELGALYDDHVAVRGALAKDEQVVVAGYTGLVPGEQVEQVTP
jgi:RND family efflux transporter MFP subunit